MRATPVSVRANAFRGYESGPIPREDAELTHVDKGSPAGEYFRRFWQPVCYSDELGEVPVKVRLLGEDLIAFRDLSGDVGLLDRHCPHRGTSLEFGLISEHGIRCCYHGWLFDVDGTILDVPAEPAGSTIPERFCAGAYPTHVFNGTVFAYLGPRDERPPFPMLDTFDQPGFRLMPGRSYIYPCNWLQILENAVDPAHTAFLHTIVSGSQFTEEFGVLAEFSYRETPVGTTYVAARRVDANVWVRMVEIIHPNIQQVSPIWETGKVEHGPSGPMMTRWVVPVDNTNTMLLEFRHIPDDLEGVPDWWTDRDRMLPAQLPISDDPVQNQLHPGDYEAQVGQRPISIHDLEHLGTTDRGVMMFRRQLKRGIDAVRAGHDPQGVVRDQGGVVTTYTNDVVVRVPPAASAEEDRALLRAVAEEHANRHLAR
jgi:phenylpropionate dioxygenase-like ring-hydroxylating dioxygenase large terminal subunit